MTSGPCGVAQGKDGDGVLGGAFDGLTTLGTLDGAPVTHCDIGIVRCSMSLRFCARRLFELTSTHACLYLHICVHKHIDLIYWYVYICAALH